MNSRDVSCLRAQNQTSDKIQVIFSKNNEQKIHDYNVSVTACSNTYM